MKELIGKIFKNNNFELLGEFDNIDFYNNKDYTSFYLVNYIDLTKYSNDKYFEELNELEDRYIGRENQVRLKDLLYENIDNDEDKKALDKNLSAVYVIKVNDSKKFYDNRNLIYEIEESPYFFKRYVLAYTQEQLAELKNTISNGDIYAEIYTDEYLSKFVDDFDEYKKLMNNEGDGYYELLVRLFCKLPFLNFITSNEISIDSLEKKIEDRIWEEENLKNIHSCLIDKTILLEDSESEEENNKDSNSDEENNEDSKSNEEILIERFLKCIDEPKGSDVDKKLREYLGE